MIREKLYTFFMSMPDLGSDMGKKNWLVELFHSRSGLWFGMGENKTKQTNNQTIKRIGE